MPQSDLPLSFQRYGSGPALVLVHGTLDDHRYWHPVVDLFSGRFTVYAVDRRGRGRSGAHPPDYRLEDEYRSIAALVESIGDPVHLLGHSSGARYSLHAAMLVPNLRTLTLYEPPPLSSPPAEFMQRLERLTAAGDREAIVAGFWTEMVGIPPEGVEALRGTPGWRIAADNAHTLLPELRAFGEYVPEPGAIATLNVPALVLTGSGSPLFLRDQADAVAGMLPDSRLVVLEGQGHEAIHTAPDLFAGTVMEFLLEQVSDEAPPLAAPENP